MAAQITTPQTLPNALRLMLAALLLTLLVPAAANEAQLRDKQAELDRVRTRIESLQRTVERERRLKNDATSRLEQSERKIAALSREADTARSAADKQQLIHDQATAQRAAAARRLEREHRALGQQLRAAYLMGREVRTKLLLSQDDPASSTRVGVYYDYLHRARQHNITGLQSELAELDRLQATVRRERERLQAIQAQHETTLAALKEQRAERARLVADMEQRISAHFRELEQLESDRAELDALLSRLRDLLADIPVDAGDEDFARLRGRLYWPLKGELLASFGAPKAGGQARWNGIWIAAESGAPVRAVASGRVAYVGWMLRYGLIAIVEHSGGYYSLYGHNQSVWKEAGQWVKAGETLASAGDSGGQSRPGVYLEIRSGRDPQNPLKWLARR